MKKEEHLNQDRAFPLLILGCGYVGSEVLRRNPQAHFTKRSSFELSNRETWHESILGLPADGIVLWTFPAACSEQEELLAVELYDRFFREHRVVIYGSTSSYLVGTEGEWVTEETPLNLAQVRTRTEEKLRQKGACILQLAGIFGPGRDPVKWYEKGYIQTGLSYLNLIHLRDIVSITQQMFSLEKIAGERFNLSNGKPKTHFEIVDELKERNLLPSDFSLPIAHKPDSKRVSNEKIKKRCQLNDDDFIDFPERRTLS